MTLNECLNLMNEFKLTVDSQQTDENDSNKLEKSMLEFIRVNLLSLENHGWTSERIASTYLAKYFRSFITNEEQKKVLDGLTIIKQSKALDIELCRMINVLGCGGKFPLINHSLPRGLSPSDIGLIFNRPAGSVQVCSWQK